MKKLPLSEISKAELKRLRNWAEREIDEWRGFHEIIQKELHKRENKS